MKSRRWTAYRYIITLASSLKFPKIYPAESWKLPLSTTPLSFDAPSTGNLPEYPHKRYSHQKLESMAYISAADSMGLDRSIFIQFSATECVSAVQGHPRSLILAPIESTCAISYRTRKPSCSWQTRARPAKSLHGLRKSSGVVVSCIASLLIDSVPMVYCYVLYTLWGIKKHTKIFLS